MRMGLGVGYKGLLSASRRAARSRSTRNGGDGLAAQVAHPLLLVELAVALQAERDAPRVDARRDADGRRARWAVFVELVLADGSVRVRQVLPSIVRVHAKVAVFVAALHAPFVVERERASRRVVGPMGWRGHVHAHATHLARGRVRVSV